MTDRVTVNKARTALLPPNSPEAGIRITREEAAKLGLVDTAPKPIQERRTPAPAYAERVGPTAPRKPQKRRSKR